MKQLKICLSAFGEGDGAAAPAAAQGQAAQDAGPAAAPPTGAGAPQAAAQQAARPSFDELIKGEYKQDYESRMQAAMDRRFRSVHAEMAELQPIMAILRQRYGVAEGKGAAEAVRQALEKDDAYWQNAADASGMTAEQFRRMTLAEAESSQLRALLAAQQTEQRRNEVMRLLSEQAGQVKAQIPGFDLDRELQTNPRFGDLLRSGVDMLSAYQVCHQQEFMAAAAQQAQAATMDKVRANRARPAENGSGSAPAIPELGNDPAKWTKKQFREVQRRVARGERIVL